MESTPKLVASIILEVSITKVLDYIVPTHLETTLKRGMCVEVPLRTTSTRGFCIEVRPIKEQENSVLRPIIRTFGTEPVLTEELFRLALWMSEYYICPLGKVLKTCLPAGVRKHTQFKQYYYITLAKTPKTIREACITLRTKAPQQVAILEELLIAETKGLFQSELLEKTNASYASIKSLYEKGYINMQLVRQDRPPFENEEYFKVKPKVLRHEQSLALEKIVASLKSVQFSCHLLFGITGSGKTEVYLQAIHACLEAKKGVIMLVPEISLTPQTVQHFRSRFDEQVAVLHYQLTDAERLEVWEKIQRGESRICIGARSAIFCPMPDIGLIIVDEEHELSYKQTEDSPCYSGRDVAMMRAKFNECTIVLGSATPSVDSYYHAEQGKITLSLLKERSDSARLPQVHIVDMKREYEKAKGITLFSDLLLKKVEERRAKGELSILFLNRRGYHTMISCTSCGKTLSCPHCDKSMTYHKNDHRISCHLCGLSASPQASCPHCTGQQMIRYQGVGTEKIESMLHGIFPGILTTRIDRDTTRHKGALEKLIQEFRSGKSEVLIGTQMVAKGLHFPQVTLVGVLNADSAINIPDFRAQETTFQLITQVAGRAGRGYAPGEVVIQTTLPEHSTIISAANQDYVTFWKEEIETRKQFIFPPFCKIVKFLFASKDEKKGEAYAESYLELLTSFLPSSYYCHPVVPCGHSRIKDLYRFQFIVRGKAIRAIREAIVKSDKQQPLPSGVFRFIDVDPSSLF